MEGPCLEPQYLAHRQGIVVALLFAGATKYLHALAP